MWIWLKLLCLMCLVSFCVIVVICWVEWLDVMIMWFVMLFLFLSGMEMIFCVWLLLSDCSISVCSELGLVVGRGLVVVVVVVRLCVWFM